MSRVRDLVLIQEAQARGVGIAKPTPSANLR